MKKLILFKGLGLLILLLTQTNCALQGRSIGFSSSGAGSGSELSPATGVVSANPSVVAPQNGEVPSNPQSGSHGVIQQRPDGLDETLPVVEPVAELPSAASSEDANTGNNVQGENPVVEIQDGAVTSSPNVISEPSGEVNSQVQILEDPTGHPNDVLLVVVETHPGENISVELPNGEVADLGVAAGSEFEVNLNPMKCLSFETERKSKGHHYGWLKQNELKKHLFSCHHKIKRLHLKRGKACQEKLKKHKKDKREKKEEQHKDSEAHHVK